MANGRVECCADKQAEGQQELGGRNIRHLGPLTFAHQRFGFAVFGDAVNVEFTRADHPVHMHQRCVHASCQFLFRRHVRCAFHVLGIGLAHGDVAGGVFVVEGFVEDEAGRRDGRGMRHQCHFAQTRCAIIRRDHFLEHVAALVRSAFDDAAFFEAHGYAFNHGALIGQGLRRAHHAIDAFTVWHGEDFFRGNVRIAEMPFRAIEAPPAQT